MDKKILCISGRKQAGKDTCYKFLASLYRIPSLQWDVRQFYFADALKRMIIDILGCPERLVYGSDEDKNTLVEHLLWENFPVPVFDMSDGRVQVGGLHDEQFEDSMIWSEWVYGVRSGPRKPGGDVWGIPKRGPMSVREVLQYYGTEIFRRQYHDVWADACIRKVAGTECDLAVLTDCRFPNEVAAAQAAGGKVVRLARVVFPGDQHESEVALDRDRYDWANFDAVIENQDMSVDEQCFYLYLQLRKWGWLPEISGSQIRRHYRAAEVASLGLPRG